MVHLMPLTLLLTFTVRLVCEWPNQWEEKKETLFSWCTSAPKTCMSMDTHIIRSALSMSTKVVEWEETRIQWGQGTREKARKHENEPTRLHVSTIYNLKANGGEKNKKQWCICVLFSRQSNFFFTPFYRWRTKNTIQQRSWECILWPDFYKALTHTGKCTKNEKEKENEKVEKDKRTERELAFTALVREMMNTQWNSREQTCDWEGSKCKKTWIISTLDSWCGVAFSLFHTHTTSNAHQWSVVAE